MKTESYTYNAIICPRCKEIAFCVLLTELRNYVDRSNVFYPKFKRPPQQRPDGTELSCQACSMRYSDEEWLDAELRKIPVPEEDVQKFLEGINKARHLLICAAGLIIDRFHTLTAVSSKLALAVEEYAAAQGKFVGELDKNYIEIKTRWLNGKGT